MSYTLKVEGFFSAAHAIRGYGGNCERLHGHNFRVCASFHTDKLDKIGMGVDFKRLNKALEEVLKQLDHSDLCTNVLLGGLNPTAENIAEAIFKALAKGIKGLPARLVALTVHESEKYGVTYYE